MKLHVVQAGVLSTVFTGSAANTIMDKLQSVLRVNPKRMKLGGVEMPCYTIDVGENDVASVTLEIRDSTIKFCFDDKTHIYIEF